MNDQNTKLTEIYKNNLNKYVLVFVKKYETPPKNPMCIIYLLNCIYFYFFHT